MDQRLTIAFKQPPFFLLQDVGLAHGRHTMRPKNKMHSLLLCADGAANMPLPAAAVLQAAPKNQAKGVGPKVLKVFVPPREPLTPPLRRWRCMRISIDIKISIGIRPSSSVTNPTTSSSESMS